MPPPRGQATLRPFRGRPQPRRRPPLQSPPPVVKGRTRRVKHPPARSRIARRRAWPHRCRSQPRRQPVPRRRQGAPSRRRRNRLRRVTVIRRAFLRLFHPRCRPRPRSRRFRRPLCRCPRSKSSRFPRRFRRWRGVQTTARPKRDRRPAPWSPVRAPGWRGPAWGAHLPRGRGQTMRCSMRASPGTFAARESAERGWGGSRPRAPARMPRWMQSPTRRTTTKRAMW
jgi:hypothetical protein